MKTMLRVIKNENFYIIEDVTRADHWLLFDRILQQLCTQGEGGENREVALVDINVSSIVKL